MSKRNMIPIGVPMQTVDAGTGEVVEESTATFQMMPARPGTCEVCATKHEPHLPHNAQSLFYQMRFNAENGRYPDWRDATAHCSEEMRTLWRDHLVGMGVDFDGGGINPIKAHGQ